MAKRDKIIVNRRNMQPERRLDDVFDDFRRDLENFMSKPFPSWSFPGSTHFGELVRTPLFDMLDRGNKYELHIEVPGIDKEKIKVHATRNAVEVSGEQSEKSSDKSKHYVHNERSYNSFYRKIETPEEIVPSKIGARMVNGILNIELPKKSPRQAEKSIKVDIK